MICKGIHTYIHTDRQTERLATNQTDRFIDIDRQADRQVSRQVDMLTDSGHKDRQTCRNRKNMNIKCKGRHACRD